MSGQGEHGHHERKRVNLTALAPKNRDVGVSTEREPLPEQIRLASRTLAYVRGGGRLLCR